MNEVKVFANEELGFKVRTILNSDGSISVNAEDTAIGYGWTKTETKNGRIYTSVRWERMNSFSAECGFAHEWSKEEYLPESLFYMLGFKAGNDRALKYQQWLAADVLPSIRRTGSYQITKMSPEEMMRIQLGMLDEQGERLGGVESRVDKLENTMTIDYGQQQELQSLAKAVAVNTVGGKKARAYTYQYPPADENDKQPKMYGMVISRLWHDYQDFFSVNSYKNTPVKRLDEALKYLNNW